MTWVSRHKLIVGMVGSVIVIAGLLAAEVLVASRDAKRVRAVADAFVAPDDWTLAEEHVNTGWLCQTVKCPGVARLWVAPRPIAPAELMKAVRDARWSLESFLGDCQALLPETDRLCRGVARKGGWTITFSVTGPYHVRDGDRYWLTMSVE